MFLHSQVVELPKEEPEAALRLFADIPGGASVQHSFEHFLGGGTLP